MKASYCKCLTSEYTIIMLIHSYSLFFICIADVFMTSSLLYKHCVMYFKYLSEQKDYIFFHILWVMHCYSKKKNEEAITIILSHGGRTQTT